MSFLALVLNLLFVLLALLDLREHRVGEAIFFGAAACFLALVAICGGMRE